ncbi:MAG: hypothetical protein SPL12_00535 [Bacteroidales bacterium]|nr:hypothetical protein [Bacteroidales bacterium]MDY6370770.1 hypothetical protein [Bacteroidales bacterium]
MLFASCQKEETTGTGTRINLFAEEANGGNAKMVVDGYATKWNTGDTVRVYSNGSTTPTWHRVEVDANQNAYIMRSPASDEFRWPLFAVTPDLPCVANGSNMTVTLPSTYVYTTTSDGSKQVLKTPMAAYGTSGDRLDFTYLTGALTVKVASNGSSNIYVKSISVTSSSYQLCGDITVDPTNPTNIQPRETADASLRTVTMELPELKGIRRTGDVFEVQIPVLPVGNNNQFTIKVVYTNKNEGSASATVKHWFTFTRKQSGSNDNHLNRGQLGYAKVQPTIATAQTGDEMGTGLVVPDYFYKDAQGYIYIMNKNEFNKMYNLQASSIYLPANSKIKITADITPGTGFVVIPWKNVVEVDGGGHTITEPKLGYRFDDAYGLPSYSGLLADPDNAVVKNLTLHNPTLNITEYTTHAGAFVAKANSVNLTNCNITGTLTFRIRNDRRPINYTPSTNLYMGGLCGYVEGRSEINRCSIYDTKYDFSSANSAFYPDAEKAFYQVGLQLYVGGLLGYSYDYIRIEDCSVGINRTSTSTQSYIKNLNATTSPSSPIYFGGMVGYSNGSSRDFTRDTVNITNRLDVFSHTIWAGSLIGGSDANWLNVFAWYCHTAGSIRVKYHNNSTSGYGNANNKYVCGRTAIQPASSGATNLRLTITSTTL